jgi:peptidoglycan/xylan/chitin deacetylase (PgdA/CDA1 family)
MPTVIFFCCYSRTEAKQRKKLNLKNRCLKKLNIISDLLGKLFGTITHVSTKKKVIALTFDDGPHPNSTPQLLDILNKHNARATFFMLGKRAKKFPELVKEAAERGHAICNHSWDHPSFPYIPAFERRAQIRQCRKALAPYGQRLFRPPYGDQTFGSKIDAILTGHLVVTWSVVINDWLEHEAQWYLDRLEKRIVPGSIVLLHDSLYNTIEDNHDKDRRQVFQAIDIFLGKIDNEVQICYSSRSFQFWTNQKKTMVTKKVIHVG